MTPTKILIVDDEILVRLALKTLIDWKKHGFEIIGEAENGIQALDLLREVPAEIVLTDIRMPEMDGLALIASVAASWPETRCLILSNHNDFEYVQQALRLGAVDYILKLAWVPEELLSKCIRIRDQLESERHERTEQNRLVHKVELLGKEAREKQLRDLFTKHSTKIEIDNLLKGIQLDLTGGDYRVVCVSIDQYQKVMEENRFKSEQLLAYTVCNIMSEILKKHSGGELVEIQNGKFALLCDRFDPTILEDIRYATLTYASVSLSFGISRVRSQSYDIQQAYLEAERALNRRFFDSDEYLFYSETYSAAVVSKSWTGSVQEELWMRLLEPHMKEEASMEIERWVIELKQSNTISPEAIRDRWMQLLYLFNHKLELQGKDLYSVPSFLERHPFEVIRTAETLKEMAEWFSGWLMQALDFVRHTTGTRYRQEIQSVMDIIQAEYHTPIKISDIARRVGFAENYLSVLFKKETGEKIVDYLTRVRMKKARELLANPVHKIYEISEMVGYGDSSHFSKYFKKIEGLFPLEYRKMVLGRE
jgi:two-component system, response regulator YesN